MGKFFFFCGGKFHHEFIKKKQNVNLKQLLSYKIEKVIDKISILAKIF